MASSSPPLSQDRLPNWLAEALDVLTARRRLVVGVALGLVIVGAMAALAVPSILPPRPVVGLAVGIAAALLATAVALAIDASDLIVRGVRHVTAAGGKVNVRVGRLHDDVGPLVAAVARHADDEGRVRVALTPASRSAAVPGPRAAALAEALARTGRKVLLTDLTRGSTPAAGLSDVVAGTRQLSEVVRFEQEVYLARLAVGSDPTVAISGFGRFVRSLPPDLEVLVTALPPLAEAGVLSAAQHFDVTFVLVEVDRTERVDLIATLDAMDAAPVTSELVLIDPSGASPVTAAAPPPAPADPSTTVTRSQPEDTQTEAEGVDVPTPTGPPSTDEPVESVVRGVASGPAALVDPSAETHEPPAAAYSFERPQEGDEVEEPDELAAGTAAEPTVAAEPELALDPDLEPEPPAEPEPEPEVEPEPEPVADLESEPEPATAESAPEPDDTAEIVLPPAAAAPPPPEPVPQPEPQPVAEAEPEPEPHPVASGQMADRVDEDPGLDLAAVEAARTSAALQQLAQQIWDREER